MASTISVSDQTRKRLMMLKIEEGSQSIDELLTKILSRYRKMQFLEASDLFRKKLAAKGLRFEDLVE